MKVKQLFTIGISGDYRFGISVLFHRASIATAEVSKRRTEIDQHP